VVQKDLLLKSMQNDKIKEIQDARRKVLNYAKYVKEIHYPRVFAKNEDILDKN